jgi:hypothetical protein
MAYKNLKDEQYYIDLYDRHTVKEGRELIKHWQSDKTKNTFSKRELAIGLHIFLYCFKGDRFEKKAKIISEFMKDDEAKDKLLESSKAPKRIHCLICGSLMKPISKDLYWGLKDKEEDRVLFMYDCPNKCKPRRAFFNNGEEYIHKPHLCPKCGNPLKIGDKSTKTKIITTETCDSCGYKNRDESDFSIKKDRPDKNFAKDRQKFCLSEKDGQEYITFKSELYQLGNIIKDAEEGKKLKKKMKHIKKLNIAGLIKFLNKPLKEQGYQGLTFSKPKIDQDLIINFTIQDAEPKRMEYNSQHILKKTIITILKNTNWRLMSSGINYKLGVLSGKLRGKEYKDE